MKIISVVGARPNFIKAAPILKAVEKYNSNPEGELLDHLLVNSGQHYSEHMSGKFFSDLGMPEPDIDLCIGSGTHAEQVGGTMIAFEKVLREHKPDWVMVYGDINATLACSVTSKKECVKCCHIEAGLRSRDMSMPEEINRVVTDRISDLLMTPDKFATGNLLKEGISSDQIRFVGNIMIDTLEQNRHQAECLSINSIIKDNVLTDTKVSKVSEEEFALVTLHRPSNADNGQILQEFIRFLSETVIKDMHVIWPVHPRTYKNLVQFGLLYQLGKYSKIILTHPLGYHEMLRMNMGAKMMMTDSGGLQEECTILGTPCLTLRNNTERPVTLLSNGGTNVLVGNNFDILKTEYNLALSKNRIPLRPELWDGKTAMRIIDELISFPEKTD